MIRTIPALLATALLAVTSTAGATAVYDYGTLGRHKPQESGQTAAVELRIGRYVPRIDDEFDGATPYRETFGTKNRYSFGFEVDWQALRIPYLGTFGPGFSLAYTKISGHGFLAEDPTTRAEEETSLTLVPLAALGVLRADVIARETPVPLVPYAKVGLGLAFWSVGDGNATARTDEGRLGRGTSYGPAFALGGMLLLDAFEPDAAVELDSTSGVNNSYVFFEWFVSILNGFGSGNQMNVGTNTWVLGLALEL